MRMSNKMVIWLLVASGLVPILGATVVYYFVPAGTPQTYGELQRPVPALKMGSLTDVSGKPVDIQHFMGKWRLIMVAPAACAKPCPFTAHAIRNIRIAQSREIDRVERVWLVSDRAPLVSLPERDQAGLSIVRAEGSPLVQQLQKLGPTAGAIYVSDPLGNLVFRYPASADPRKIIKELAKLLRNNERIG